MADAEKDIVERPDEWLLIKRDLYWRPNSCGYTGLRDEAGRYTYAEASPRCNGGVSMVHISEAPEFRDAVWDDLLVAHLLKQRSERDDTITTLRAEVERLGGLVYAPGRWKCVKCDFTLLQSNLNAATGNVTARHEAGGVCPNCNSPLWRVSWKAEAQENQTISETQFDRAMAAEAERDSQQRLAIAAIARAEKAEAALEPFANIKMVPYSATASDDASIELSGFELIDGKAFIKASAFRLASDTLSSRTESVALTNAEKVLSEAADIEKRIASLTEGEK